MSLNVSVSRGNTMVAGVKWDVDDWNAAFLPVFTLSGTVGTSDMADDAITFALLNPNLILGGTTIEDLDSADKFLVGQASSGDNRVITFQHTLRSIVRECDEVSTFVDYNEDRIIFFRHSDDLPVTMGLGRFAEQTIEQAPETATTNQDWEVLVRRSTEPDGAQVARATLRNLLPDVTTAKTVNMPTQIVVDAKGRVTSVSATEGSNRFTSAETALPTADGAAGQVDIAHGLGSRPAFYTIWFKCTDAGGDGTWAQNDIIDQNAIVFDNGANRVPYIIRPSATHLSILKPAGTSIYTSKKTDGTDVAVDTTKWKVIVEAMK